MDLNCKPFLAFSCMLVLFIPLIFIFAKHCGFLPNLFLLPKCKVIFHRFNFCEISSEVISQVYSQVLKVKFLHISFTCFFICFFTGLKIHRFFHRF